MIVWGKRPNLVGCVTCTVSYSNKVISYGTVPFVLTAKPLLKVCYSIDTVRHCRSFRRV